MVTWDADAFGDFESLTNRAERKATLATIWKLRDLGGGLGPPHMKSLRGEPGLVELRPRQGASPVRLIYRRSDDAFVILAAAVKADKADFGRALTSARKRYSRYGS